MSSLDADGDGCPDLATIGVDEVTVALRRGRRAEDAGCTGYLGEFDPERDVQVGWEKFRGFPSMIGIQQDDFNGDGRDEWVIRISSVETGALRFVELPALAPLGPVPPIAFDRCESNELRLRSTGTPGSSQLFVPARFEGREVYFLLDTGSPETFLFGGADSELLEDVGEAGFGCEGRRCPNQPGF